MTLTKISPLCYLTDKGKLKLKPASKIVEKLSEAWDSCLAFKDETKTFWQYGAEFPGLWSERSETLIRKTIQEALDATGVGYGDVVSTIFKLLQGKLAVTKWREKKGVTPMKNGVLDNATLKLMPHSPANYLCWQLPYDYNPLATCDPIQEWLAFTQDGDVNRVQLLRAYLKAIVMGRSDLQRFLEVIAIVGGSGKSTYCNLAIALVGLENVHCTNSETLDNSRFETANFKGKRLVYFADNGRYMSEKAIGILKNLTGNDAIPYERKGKDALAPFYYKGMILRAANHALTTTDTAVPRRRMTIPFLKAIEQADQHPLLELDSETNTLSGEFEPCIPGLLNWVLSMSDAEMVRYLKDTDRAVPSLAAVKADTLISVNPMAAWLDDCCVLTPGVRTGVGVAKKIRHSEGENGTSTSWESYAHATERLYPNYNQYCDLNRHTAVLIKRFGADLKNLTSDQLKYTEVIYSSDRDGAYFMGIALRNESHNSLPRPISGGEVLAEVGPIEPADMPVDSPALPTDDWDEPTPSEWQALPQNDRQQAEQLLHLLRQAATPSAIWFNPMEYNFSDRARQSVSAYLQTSDREFYDRVTTYRRAA